LLAEVTDIKGFVSLPEKNEAAANISIEMNELSLEMDPKTAKIRQSKECPFAARSEGARKAGPAAIRPVVGGSQGHGSTRT
jgi:hypothetical protein